MDLLEKAYLGISGQTSDEIFQPNDDCGSCGDNDPEDNGFCYTCNETADEMGLDLGELL